MAEVSGDPRAVENLKSYLDVIKESYAANPWKARLLLVLTADDSDPQFNALEEGLRARAAENSAKAISGIGLYMANFAILLLEGLTSGVMNCMRWLDTLCQSQKVKQGLVLFFSDCRTYRLMPTYWSLRPKEFLEMKFEEGENEMTEEEVAKQVMSLYEKMIYFTHELKATQPEADVRLSPRLEPAGLLAKEFARFAPDPRAVQNLLSSPKTFSLLFSVPEFCENLLGDFYATLPRDRAF
ncbi:hypothetical protein, conserved [Eimeria tenella]|uniref:Uncharacterized protein n=1 Tax=Eimeria tenella TaxID=5802 RepID=U6L0K5_EIMTE|nr:hypothetical protein, conserved [Eimeria tenella]CDJ42728.1 hypothetical protein, conserved [Eimeria tenella]|eukprot:XP_013233478.1 hypothetical protein, conserved [Eimeria tenella]